MIFGPLEISGGFLLINLTGWQVADFDLKN
jgi:hypothetical protein